MVPVDDIALARGVEVHRRDLKDELAGFLLRKGSRMVIGVNSSHSSTRQRFTVAHELGHALLHEGDELHVDEGFRINLRSPESSTAKNIEEIEANTFAAALLMPIGLLRKQIASSELDIEDDKYLRCLAREYGVSQAAMSYRLLSLSNHTKAV